MKVIRAAVAAVLSLALGVFGLTAFAPPASAHEPSVATTCEGLTVDLVNYQIDPGQKGTFTVVHHAAIPETFTPGAHHDAVLETFHTEKVAADRYSWNGGPSVDHPYPSLGDWQKNTSTYNGTDPLGKAFESGQGQNSSWFYWTTKDVQVSNKDGKAAYNDPPVSNHDGKAAWDESVSNHDFRAPGTNGVIVMVNGAEVANNSNFGTTYHGTFPFLPNHVNAYMVMVNSQGYTKTFQGTVEGCVVTVSATMNLTYMTGCAPDSTNTWRTRNGSTFAVPFTLEYVGQSMLISGIAPVGDSFLETPRMDATAILRWGGGDSGIIAGSVTKASGRDEVSDKCAGDKPADKVITKDVGAPDCGATTVKTETTTTGYIREGNGWILDVGHAVTIEGTRTLTSEEMVLFQNTNPDGVCYVKPMIKDATTAVTTAKWECNDKTAVTSSVTTAYSFAFDSKTGTYGPAIPKAGAPVAGVRNLTATEFVACPVLAVEPVPSSSAAPVVTQDVLASTGANDVTPWGVGAGLLALLTGAGLLIARKKA
jgi:LPXTG-motif cell wall-anchored protein